MKELRPVIITGMHRSGTSLTANLLQLAGVNLGTRLLGAWPGNPRGHFEDVDVLEFHETLLRRRGTSFFAQSIAGLQPITAQETKEAQELIEARQGQGLWGWKEPRTTLFLNLWNQLLPEARFVFVYRHPIDVVLSLLRRATDPQALASPFLAMHVWSVYNQAILAFAQQHRHRCLVCHVAGLTKNIPRLAELMETRFGLSLDFVAAQHTYSPDLLHQHSSVSDPRLHALLKKLAPDVVALYSELDAMADLPSDSPDETSNLDHPMLPQLMRFAERMEQDKPWGASSRSPIFSLLLGLVAPEVMMNLPETALGSIERMVQDKADSLSQRQEISQNLERTIEHMERLSRGNAKLMADFEESNHRVEALQTQVQVQKRASDARVEVLAAELQEGKKRIAMLEAVRGELDLKKAEVEILEKDRTHQRARIQELEDTVQAQHLHNAQQETELARQAAMLKVIRGSRSWRLVEAHWKARRWLRILLGRSTKD